MSGGSGMKFGSLLKDHPDVLRQADKYPHTNTFVWWNNDNAIYKQLPEVFDGRNAWEAYIQFPSDQLCSDSWSIVATDILADRYTILTAGQINLFLSSTEIVSCIGKKPLPKIEGVISGAGLDYKDACQGYSIYDAWEYMYENGVSETNCFSHNKLVKMNMPLPYSLSFPEKIKVYGQNCSNIEGNQLYCITKKDDKPIARRTFFCDGIFNITGDTLDQIITNIKYELLRFGPVAAGFNVYENFANGYDGKTVYEKVEGKPLGGHYVSIVGWEKDTWICRNSWGTQWGLLGFYKMKMGIPECKLENNVSAIAPFYHTLAASQKVVNDGLWNGQQVDVTDMKLFNPDLWAKRNTFDIDPETFYPKKALALIKDGSLYGDLTPFISFPNELPNSNYYWAKDFKNFKFVTETFGSDDEHDGWEVKWLVRLVGLSLIAFAFYRGYRKTV